MKLNAKFNINILNFGNNVPASYVLLFANLKTTFTYMYI